MTAWGADYSVAARGRVVLSLLVDRVLALAPTDPHSPNVKFVVDEAGYRERRRRDGARAGRIRFAWDEVQ